MVQVHVPDLLHRVVVQKGAAGGTADLDEVGTLKTMKRKGVASSLETYCTTRGILTSQTSNITIATVPIGSAHPVPTITVDVQRLVQVTNVVGHQLSVARGRVVVRGNIGERWRCTDAGHLAGEQTVRGVLGAHQDTGVRATDGLPEGEGEQRSRPRYFHQVSWFTRLGLGVRPIRISDSGTHIGIQNGGVKGNSEVVAWGRPPSSIVVVPICRSGPDRRGATTTKNIG